MRGDPNNPAFRLAPRPAYLGTPAGQGPYTQEQHLAMRERGMAMNNTPAMRVLFVTGQHAQLSVTDQMAAAMLGMKPIEALACPVIGFGATWAEVIAPDGSKLQLRR